MMRITPSVHLFEEHSSTLPVWWQHNKLPLTVVYLDAHLDLQKINATNVADLVHCDRVQQVEKLASPNHLVVSPSYAYGIENFLYAAVSLKLLDRLIWVAPPHVPRTYSPQLLHYVQQMDGISFEELTGFVPTGTSSIRGRLLGLDLTICDYTDIEYLEISSPYVLDIDVDYFVHIPGDQLWADPCVVLQRIISQLDIPELATISRAVSSGFTPLHLRFLGDYIASFFSGNTSMINHYAGLIKAARSLKSGSWQTALGHCQNAIKLFLIVPPVIIFWAW